LIFTPSSVATMKKGAAAGGRLHSLWQAALRWTSVAAPRHFNGKDRHSTCERERGLHPKLLTSGPLRQVGPTVEEFLRLCVLTQAELVRCDLGPSGPKNAQSARHKAQRKLGKKFTSARAPPPQKAEPAQPSGIASKKYFGRARRYVTCVTFANASLCHSSKPQCELIALGQAGRRTHGECTQLLSRSSGAHQEIARR
jgi:hypothetical protein